MTAREVMCVMASGREVRGHVSLRWGVTRTGQDDTTLYTNTIWLPLIKDLITDKSVWGEDPVFLITMK